MKICLQAGHKGMTTGAIGASGERDWNTQMVSLLAKKLRESGVEVYETDAFGNKDPKVTKTDWDLFLAIHYDADIYNDRGGFIDFPDASIDDVHEVSVQLANKIGTIYFTKSGIPLKPNRSNANTRFYYMWQFLTSKTPCVILECGVGARKPEDFNTLRDYTKMTSVLSEAILTALGVIDPRDLKIQDLEEEIISYQAEVKDLRLNRNKYRDLSEKQEKEIVKLNKSIEEYKIKLEDALKNASKLELIKAIFAN